MDEVQSSKEYAIKRLRGVLSEARKERAVKILKVAVTQSLVPNLPQKKFAKHQIKLTIEQDMSKCDIGSYS